MTGDGVVLILTLLGTSVVGWGSALFQEFRVGDIRRRLGEAEKSLDLEQQFHREMSGAYDRAAAGNKVLQERLHGYEADTRKLCQTNAELRQGYDKACAERDEALAGSAVVEGRCRVSDASIRTLEERNTELVKALAAAQEREATLAERVCKLAREHQIALEAGRTAENRHRDLLERMREVVA